MTEYIYEQHRARKQLECNMGDGPILAGEVYLSATIAGGGLQALKFPTYIHLRCKGKHMDKHKTNQAGDRPA